MTIHIETEARIATAIMERKGQAGTVFAHVQYARAAEFSCRGFVQVEIDSALGLQPAQIMELAAGISASVKGIFQGDETVARICDQRSILIMPVESLAVLGNQADVAMRKRMERMN